MAMTKVIMSLGYNDYVLDLADAVTVIEIMAKAERYKAKWRKGDDTTYHVWTDDGESVGGMTLKHIGDNLYRTAKLAGEPTED
jgi:hypothetical protein